MEEKEKKEKNISLEDMTKEQLLTIAKEAIAQKEYLSSYVNNEVVASKLYKELELMFKILEYASFFEPETIDRCVNVISKVMSPTESKRDVEDK